MERKAPSTADVFEPLWERTDRNRRRYAVLVVVYVLATAASFILIAYLGVLFVPGLAWTVGGFWGVAAGTLGMVALYTLWAVGNSEKVVLRRVGARVAEAGTHLETRRALYDMSIAAGWDHPPVLYVIDSSTVNAMVVGRSPRTGAVAVTRGLSAQLSIDEERAIYAHLLSRLNARDLSWATVATVLMHPLWVWKKRYYDVVPFKERPAIAPLEATGTSMRGGSGVPMGSSDMYGDGCMFFPPYLVAVFVAHYMMQGQRRSQRVSAEFADAAGLLLVKDPDAAMSALEKVVRAENHVRGCEGQYAQFFYAWTGDLSTNDEADPEFARLLRLKQTLGAIADQAPGPRLSHLFPPRAPRLDERDAWIRAHDIQ